MEGRNAGVLIGLENRDDGVKSVVQVRTLFPLQNVQFLAL